MLRPNPPHPWRFVAAFAALSGIGWFAYWFSGSATVTSIAVAAAWLVGVTDVFFLRVPRTSQDHMLQNPNRREQR